MAQSPETTEFYPAVRAVHRSGHSGTYNLLSALDLYLRGEVAKILPHTLNMDDTQKELLRRLIADLDANAGRDTWAENVPEELERVVLNYIQVHGQVTSDDVYDEILAKAGPRRSSSVIGAVFRSLGQKGLIRSIGQVPSRRPSNHGATIRIWESAK